MEDDGSRVCVGSSEEDEIIWENEVDDDGGADVDVVVVEGANMLANTLVLLLTLLKELVD